VNGRTIAHKLLSKRRNPSLQFEGLNTGEDSANTEVKFHPSGDGMSLSEIEVDWVASGIVDLAGEWKVGFCLSREEDGGRTWR
jgi:hypothetical protein